MVRHIRKHCQRSPLGIEDGFGSKLPAKVISWQLVLIHTETNVLLVMIWIQTVCKGYQQANVFHPHQDQYSFGSDLEPNCLQKLSADNKVGIRSLS